MKIKILNFKFYSLILEIKILLLLPDTAAATTDNDDATTTDNDAAATTANGAALTTANGAATTTANDATTTTAINAATTTAIDAASTSAIDGAPMQGCPTVGLSHQQATWASKSATSPKLKALFNWEIFAKHDQLSLSDNSLELFLIQNVSKKQ